MSKIADTPCKSGRMKILAAGAGIQRGVTLVELMLTLAIGTVIAGALMALFSQSITTRNQIERAGQKSEGGRFALSHLTTELRLAGFYGEFIASAYDTRLNSLCNAGAVRTNDLAWSPTATLPAAVRGIPGAEIDDDDLVDGCLELPNHRENTDVLVVWRADTCVEAGGCPGEGLPPLTPRKKIFYVAECNRCDASENPPVPTLKELSMDGVGLAWSATPVTLVPGVEQIKFTFGVDSDLDPAVKPENQDGVVDFWGAVNPVAGVPGANLLPNAANLVAAQSNANGDNWTDVVAVRISVLVRDLAPTNGHLDNLSYMVGDTEIPPANDSFKRRVFSTVSALTNVMGRRER